VTEALFLSVVATGFVVAFAHAAIPTHWLPFVLAGRGQRWSKTKTLIVVALCGSGHVLFTTVLGALLVWLGIETSKWTGNVFPWIAGGALILFGLYYLVRQAGGGGHGHSHGVHSHDAHHGAHDHAPQAKPIDLGHGMLVPEVFEDGVPARFRVPHELATSLGLAHGDHAHRHEVRFEEHPHAASVQPAPTARADQGPAKASKSDRAVILGLFTLLTFSPCEGFLPVYLSGITYGWMGFVVLSAVLAFATIAGMVIFTWLTMSGMERLRLGFLERYERGILGALILFLGVGIIFFGF
jgi:nickel/cobalt transporter (NicO) family protein